MAYGITTEGFIVKPRAVILQELNDSFGVAFGATFDTSPESPDGQIIGIMADAIHESWLREELAYNNAIPSKSFGVGLDNLVELNGIKRVVDKPTTVTVNLIGTGGTIVPAGSKVETSDGLVFTTNVEGEIPTSVTATSVKLGAIPIGIGEIDTISSENIIAGWDEVSNTIKGTTGIVRQTDPELRALRDKSTINKGTNTVAAITEAINSLNVPFVYVNDNDLGITTASGQPPNSIHVVVEGGNNQEIAEAIFNNKPAGIAAWGTNYETVYDISGNPHQIGVDSPVTVQLEVSVKILRTSNTSGDLHTAVKDALVAYIDSLPLGENVDWSATFEPILDVGGLSVLELKLARLGDTLSTNNIVITTTEKSALLSANITITE